MMINIVYVSKANVVFSKEGLKGLVATSARRNKQMGITGYLCFHNNRFFQYLEGEEDVVLAVMDKIRADSRHRILYECEEEEIDRRIFNNWSMKKLNEKELSKVGLETFIDQSMYFVNKNYYDKLRCDLYLRQQVRKTSLIPAIKVTRNIPAH